MNGPSLSPPALGLLTLDVWECDNGDLHVTGTHDLHLARTLARQFVATNSVRPRAEAMAALDNDPTRWWAVRTEPPGGDPEYARVEGAEVSGAVPMTTWPLT